MKTGAIWPIRAKAVRKISLGCRLKTSMTGARATRSSSMIFWKIGVSRMPSRIHKPMTTMIRLSQNGTRQPQLKN